MRIPHLESYFLTSYSALTRVLVVLKLRPPASTMNNPNATSASQGFPSTANLIKPEMVPKLIHLSEVTRAQYEVGVKKLWEQLNAHPPSSVEYQAVYKKLGEVTSQLRTSINKYKAEQAATQAAQAGHVAHPGQNDSTRLAGHGQHDPRSYAQSHTQGPEGPFSKYVIMQVRSQPFRVPQQIEALGLERRNQWQRDARMRYAQNLQRYENAGQKLREMNQDFSARKAAGHKFSPEEGHALNSRKSQFEKAIQETKEYMRQWNANQEQILLSQTGAPDYSGNPVNQANSNEQPHAPTLIQQQNNTDVQGQHHTVNSAVEAARNRSLTSGRPTTSPSNPAPAVPSNSNKVEIGQHSGSHDLPLNSQTTPVTNSGASSQSQPHSNQPSSTPQSATSQSVRPLSHKAAMAEAAHSYTSQPNFQPPTSQSSGHAHPQIGGGNQDQPKNQQTSQQNLTNPRMPIPKDLKVTPPQPVPMGLARPTLTGGPTNGAMGPMGQPAIQKHPGYVLEGDGERVLSKKKLEELVRQVTGGSGVESEEGETLSAEVEEVDALLSSILLTFARTRNSYHVANNRTTIFVDSSPSCR